MCPSQDRTNTRENNSETFLMSNMQPQLHSLNAGVWKSLEGYVQDLVRHGLEAYVIAGCYGDGGTLNNKGKVKIPDHCWKIVLLLTEGKSDLSRIDENTRVIAVDMSNTNSTGVGWKSLRTTVDDIEAKTGLNFFSTLSRPIEEILESRKDTN
jgi:endonuclease G